MLAVGFLSQEMKVEIKRISRARGNRESAKREDIQQLRMNYKFKKKPVQIEAFQMTEERRFDNQDWPNWLHQAWNLDVGEEGCLYCVDGGKELFISTLEGVHKVTFDDFIIRGVRGEIYPCKPDIFEATYDEVN